MDKYEMIREAIWLDESLGSITTEQAIEADACAYQIYVTEKSSAIENYIIKRGIKQFKKQYKFEPINGSKTQGYIMVDGKKTRIDLDVFNPLMKVSAGKGKKKVFAPRQTAAELNNEDERVVHIDKNTISLIINKAKKAIYDHEFAHLDFDSLGSDIKHHHPKVVEEQIKNSIVNMGLDPDDKTIYNSVASEVKPWADKYLKDIEKVSKVEREKRDDLYNKTKKYVIPKSGHSSSSEIVADAVSVAKNGKFIMALALKMATKKSCTKDALVEQVYAVLKSQVFNNPIAMEEYRKKSPEEKEKAKKELYKLAVDAVNKNWANVQKEIKKNDEETKQRIKAMSDKDIQNHEYIKKYKTSK